MGAVDKKLHGVTRTRTVEPAHLRDRRVRITLRTGFGLTKVGGGGLTRVLPGVPTLSYVGSLLVEEVCLVCRVTDWGVDTGEAASAVCRSLPE